MLQMVFYKVMALLAVLQLVQSQNSVPPVWLTNDYFQTRAVQIKTNISTTFNFTNPITANIPFVKNYTTVPKLAFGIKNYKGNDAMYQQNFDFSNTGITAGGFTLFTKMVGWTNLRILTIVYMAVDQSYPYNLNTFNNIEANHSTGGPLVNITTGVGTQTYINVINYTQLANTIGSSYTSFGPNMEKNLVALYLNAIWNAGSSNKQINWTTTSPVLSQTSFQIKVVVLDGYKLTYLRFSIVAMDISDVQASGKFTIIYQSKTFWGNQTNYIPIPSAFINGTLIGLLDYAANSANCGLDFNWEPDPANNRIIINQSVVYYKSSAICGLLQYRVIVFYVKTWYCPASHIYFNLNTNLCDNYCQSYYFGNQSAQACQPCDFACYSCVPPSSNSSSNSSGNSSSNSSSYSSNVSSSGLECLSCNPLDFRQMVNGTCECILGYYQEKTNSTLTVCVPCIVVTANCAGCVFNMFDVSICTQCDIGFMLINQTCLPCTVPFCIECDYVAGVEVCLDCDAPNNYFLNVSGDCEPCGLLECVLCDNLSSCAICDTSDGYFINSTTDQCQLCNIAECLICSSLQTCIVCNLTNNYFLNSTSNDCQQCALPGCTICTSLQTCAQCNATSQYYVDPATRQCDYCNNSENYFLHPVTLDCDYCSVPYCLQCRSYFTCQVCDYNMSYFLNTTDYLCYSCNLPGCITCATLYTCAICDVPNNYNLVNSSQTCKLCPYTCICDGYYLPHYFDPVLNLTICTTVCGDGKTRQKQQCDDGNTINYDGCSSTCQIQRLWTCASSNISQYSCCNLNNSLFTMNLINTLKPLNQNAIIINLQILPIVKFMEKQNLALISTVSITGIPLYNLKKTSTGQNLSLKYNYNQSIQGKVGYVSVFLTADNSNQPNHTCTVTVSKIIQIAPRSSNNVPFMYFSKDDYKQMQKMDDTVTSAEILSYIVLFVSAIPCKIVGLELFGVLQLAYFVLAQSNFVNALLTPYMKMSSVNGLNFEIQPEDSQTTPDRVTSLGYRSLFLNNCNVMFFLLISQILVGLGIYAAAYFMKDISQKFHTISKYLLKQVLMTLLLFNAFNLSFGVGIHFTYADQNDPMYGVSSLCAIIAIALPIAAMIGLMATDPKEFGQFRNKFKPDIMSQLYFVFTIIYRYALGYYISTMNEYSLSSLIVISFSLLFLLYNLVHLPFVDAYQNYRANVCHVTQLIILFVTNYYQSMKSTTPLEQKAYYFNAAYLQIAAIYTCIGVSGICLGVQIYKFVKAKFFSEEASSKVSNEVLKNQLHTTQQGINLQKYHEITVEELAF